MLTRKLGSSRSRHLLAGLSHSMVEGKKARGHIQEKGVELTFSSGHYNHGNHDISINPLVRQSPQSSQPYTFLLPTLTLGVKFPTKELRTH